MSFEVLEAELRLLTLEKEYNKTAATLYSTGSKLNLIYQSLLKESLSITTTINEVQVEQEQGRRRQPRQYNGTSEQPTTNNSALPSSSIDLQQEETEREGDDKDSEGDDSSKGDEIERTNNKRRRRKRTKLVMPKVKRPSNNKKQKSTENTDTLTPLQSMSDSRNKTKRSNKTVTRSSDRERREIEDEASILPSCTLSTCSYSSHISLKPFTLAISRISYVPTGEGSSKGGGDKTETVSSDQPRGTTPVVPAPPLSNRPDSNSEWEMSSEISIQNSTENRKKSETHRNKSRENTRSINESSKEAEPEAEDESIIGRRRRVAEQKVQVIVITSDESEEEEEKRESKKEKRIQSRPTLTSKRYSSRPKTHVVSYKEESEEETESSSSLVTDEEEVIVTRKAQEKRVRRPRKLKRPPPAIFSSDTEDEKRRSGGSVSPLQSRHNIPESEESDSLVVPETPQKTRRLTRLNLLRLSNATPLPPSLTSGNECTASPIPHLSPPLLVPSPHDSPSEHSSPIRRTSKRGRQIQSSPIKDQHLISQSEAPSPRMATCSTREALQEKQNNSPTTKRITRACTSNNTESSTAPSSVSCTGRANSQSDATGDAASSAVTESERTGEEESVSSREFPPPSNLPKKRRKMSRPLPLPLVNQSGLSIMEITSSRISTMGLRRKTVLDSRHNSTTLLYDTYDEGQTNTSRASIRVNNSKFIAPKLKLSKKDKAL